MLKKLICTIMVFAVLCLQIPSPSVMAQDGYTASDIDTHWAEKEITTLMNAGILKGYQSKANPDKTITRGEFTALIARSLSLYQYNQTVFADILPGHMFFDEITSAFGAGIVNGAGNNMFMPDKPITREEIMLIIARCLEEKSSPSTSFSDIGKNYIYMNELETSVSSGIVTGYSDGSFRPYKNATRAECAVMLQRLLKAQDSPSEDEIEELSLEYVQNELKDFSLNDSSVTGRAKSESELKKTVKEILSSSSVTVRRIPESITLESVKTEGALSEVIYKGRITYITTSVSSTRQRTYNATYNIKIISVNGTHSVYDYSISLAMPQKVNLTWEVYSSPPDYAPQGVNVVSPSSFQISKENLGVESKELMGSTKFYNSLTRKYMDYAQANGYEVWPIYKTDFSLKTSDEFLNNRDARMKSAQYLVNYACKYMIDGINVDFENIYEKNRSLLSSHVRELSVMLHEMGLIISADITRLEPTSANWSMCYNRDLLSESCDYIMLMAYDEHYASDTRAGSVASLDWTEDSIKKTLAEVPEEKLILGIPFYMRLFEISKNKVISSKAISMQTAYELVNSNNVTYTYMEDDKQYKISWQNGSKTYVFWLENTDTIALRVSLANKYSLAGIASWRRGLEISKVWDVINQNL